jgi:hypothetical protein
MLGALGLAACGASSTSSSSAPASGGASVPSTTTAGTASGATASTSTSVGIRPPKCRAATLALRLLGQQGATGHGEVGFALRNTGSHSCRTVGYPGVQFLDQAGQPLPTTPTHTTHDFFGSAPVEALVVAPGASVSFRLGVTHGAASSAGCVTAYGLQAIPPDDTASLRTTIPQGAYECGTTTVSPLRPGESAYP